MDLGQAIRERRESLGLSLRKTARHLGCDAAYLSRIEGGKVAPSEEILSRLTTVLAMEEYELSFMAGRLPVSLRPVAREQASEMAILLRDSLNTTLAHSRGRMRMELAEGDDRAIDDGFPFDLLSTIAEAESWRKEIYRPIYHVHKWWAQRLGSVFRAAILASVVSKGAPVLDYFLQPVSLEGIVVFDPFMGSGTTVGEAHKLGATAIGCDINPVACRAVRTALGPLDRRDLACQFEALSRTVAPRLRSLYRSTDSSGQPCDVLYYFWVKVLDCPECQSPADLFPRYIFTRHADRTKDIPVFVVCPGCGQVFPVSQRDAEATCTSCQRRFDPHHGPARHTTAVCQSCGHEFGLAKAARAADHPPAHRMYAKLVVRGNGTKEYLRTTDDDLALFEQARHQLRDLGLSVPQVQIRDGRNTRQILNYGYRYWHEMFNDRQLLGLATLAQAIAGLPRGPSRDALAVLFSGVLEFNNMFASYKGEGTGAVRHMFSHHILKPERMPIEANLWGTPQSSGAFSTLYRSRLLRAVHYREQPFEIAVQGSGSRLSKPAKVYGLSPPIGRKLHDRMPKNGLPTGAICISCGDSAKTDLPDESVHLVVTDPPFFDNVHYSELADFFHVWQEHYFAEGKRRSRTTRHEAEVQDTDADAFAAKLRRVFIECHRVLRPRGRLVFSYHHSREDGWSAIAGAVAGAGFSFCQCQPVKSEMSVAAPKSQAKEPIDLDVLMVCKKRRDDTRSKMSAYESFEKASSMAEEKVGRFNRSKRSLSRNDVRVVLLSQLLVELSPDRDAARIVNDFARLLPQAKTAVEEIWSRQAIIDDRNEENSGIAEPRQLLLF